MKNMKVFYKLADVPYIPTMTDAMDITMEEVRWDEFQGAEVSPEAIQAMAEGELASMQANAREAAEADLALWAEELEQTGPW